MNRLSQLRYNVQIAGVPIFPNQYGPYMTINVEPVAMNGSGVQGVEAVI